VSGPGDLVLSVDFVSQLSRAFEGNHLAGFQEKIGTGGGISASSLCFIFDTELAKAGNENIVSVLQGLLNDFEQVFDRLDRFFLCESQIVELRNEIILGQCHGAS
jgi:hypothetical protein